MAEIQLPQRTQVPGVARPARIPRPSRTPMGGVKTLAKIGSGMFEKYLSIRVANEQHAYLGEVKAVEESWDTYLRSNPNATIEQMQAEQQRLIGELETVGTKLSLPASQQYAKNWMAANKGILAKRMEGDRNAIGIEHQTKLLNATLKTYIAEGKKKEAFNLIDINTGPDKAIHPELAEIHKKQIGMEIDIVIQKQNKALAEQWLDNEVARIADETGDWNEGAKFLTDPKTSRFVQETYGLSSDVVDGILENTLSKATYRKAQEKEAVTKELVKRFRENNLEGIEDFIESSNLPPTGANSKESWYKKYDDKIQAIIDEETDPFGETDPRVYFELRQKIARGETVTEDELAGYVGKGKKGGISIAQYEKLLGMIIDDDDLFNNRVAKRAESFLATFKTANAKTWLKNQDAYDKWYTNFISINKRPPNPRESKDYLLFLTEKPITSFWVIDRPASAVLRELRNLPNEARRQYLAEKEDFGIGESSTTWLKKWRKEKKPITEEIGMHYYLLADKDKKKAEELAVADGYIIPK